MIKVGISACFFHADPLRPVFKGKTLQYIEQSMAHWINSMGALAYMLPSPGDPITVDDLATNMDGLILHGGADISPKSYGEEPIRPEWAGDRIRDLFELELYWAFRKQEKPVLGICRGAQLINVAHGGNLYQDIQYQNSNALTHRNWEIYDQNFHSIDIVPDSQFQSLFPKLSQAKVNSIHHQGIQVLGKGLQVEARSCKDGIIECIRLCHDTAYARGIQWHPEFHAQSDPTLLDSKPILADFLDHVQKRSPHV